MCYQSAIIHISDTEFGPNNRAKEADRDGDGDYEDSHREVMDDFVADIRREVVNKYDITPDRVGLVISGDITNKGDNAEFRDAQKYINDARQKAGIPKQQVAIVPGNHDVNWDDCRDAYKAELRRGRQDGKQVRKMMRISPEKLSKFAGFFREVCGIDFKIQRPLVFKGFEKLGIALIGLDTTYPSLFTRKDNYGRIRVEQVRAAGEELKRWLANKRDLIPIALMHHSLLPNLENKKDMSYLRRWREVRRWLRDQRFGVVLCGHEHTTDRSSSLSGDFKILVTGSFGLCQRELNVGYEEGRRPETNRYQIILINPAGKSKVVYRRLNRTDSTFPMGVWEEDRSSGEPFDRIELRRDENMMQEQPDLDATIAVDIGDPVEFISKDRVRQYIVALKVRQTTTLPFRIEYVEYKVEPGGESVKGDPCCDFLATVAPAELEGRSISAHIVFENGEAVRRENIAIPNVYNPSKHLLSANYSKELQSPNPA